MADIIGRFLFVVWILSAGLTIAFGLAGWEEAQFISMIVFGVPIVAALAYTAIKWIVTGKTE